MKKTYKIIIAICVCIVIWLLLAAGIIATVFYYTLSVTRYRPPAVMSMDKSVCAASGIELLNYNDRKVNAYEFSQENQVRYKGKTRECIPSSPTEEMNAGCDIGTSEPGDDWIRISVNEDQCFVENVKGKQHGGSDYQSESQNNLLLYLLIGLAVGLLIDTIITVFLIISLIYFYLHEKDK